MIDDESWVWLNGRFLGELSEKTNPVDHWSLDRSYPGGGRDLKRRGNVLAVHDPCRYYRWWDLPVRPSRFGIR